MSSSRFTSSFYLLTFILLLQNVFGVDPLFSICSTNENSKSIGPYRTSLNVLLGSFYRLAPASGFALGSLGPNNQDRPYGLVLCRGDVSSSDCRICVANATREIRKRCPNNRAAIIGHDNCLLKHSDKEFFGQIDSQNKVYLFNVQNVSNPVTFNQKMQELLGQLADRASNTTKMYAAGELELESWSQKLYGMAQCTKDLYGADCKKCLDGAIGELPNFAYGKQGARVVGGSCTVRYEIYPFVNV